MRRPKQRAPPDPGELSRLFADFEILLYEEVTGVPDWEPPFRGSGPARLVRMIARKPGGDQIVHLRSVLVGVAVVRVRPVEKAAVNITSSSGPSVQQLARFGQRFASGSMPIRSLTASRSFCLHPR